MVDRALWVAYGRAPDQCQSNHISMLWVLPPPPPLRSGGDPRVKFSQRGVLRPKLAACPLNNLTPKLAVLLHFLAKSVLNTDFSPKLSPKHRLQSLIGV